MSHPHKIAFFGTPYVAKDTFALLYSNGYAPEIVITNPDTKQGRGLELTPSAVKGWAAAESLPVFTPEHLDTEAIAEIKRFGCDLAIVVAYGKIFPQELIEMFPKGVINVHYSLLPSYRGASPVESALLHNEEITGVTIQQMVKELDAGDILAQQEVAILPYDTAETLRKRLITEGAELLLKVLPMYEKGEIHAKPQDHATATYARKIKKEERELKLSEDPFVNWSKYRAYKEAPGTHFFTEKNGRTLRVKITDAEFKDGALIIRKVIPEGKREMEYEVFKNSL